MSNLNHTGDELNVLRCRTALKKPSESKQRRSDQSAFFLQRPRASVPTSNKSKCL